MCGEGQHGLVMCQGSWFLGSVLPLEVGLPQLQLTSVSLSFSFLIGQLGMRTLIALPVVCSKEGENQNVLYEVRGVVAREEAGRAT